jgi:hypothetical protein
MLLNPALFVLPHHEIQTIGLQNLIYGSLTKRGLATTVKHLRAYCKEPIRGLDLGCGDGELIWHLGQQLAGSEWEGVEISEHRVSQQTRDVQIWQGDMLKENFRPYNVLHADNLCLDDAIADRLEEKIAWEFQGLYLTYRTPCNPMFLRTARLLDAVRTETTWTHHTIYYYTLDGRA